MIPRSLIYLLCAALLLVLPHAAASPFTHRNRELSNAERIHRGLPLKAPKRHFDPTRPRRALSPRASDTSRSAIMVLTDPATRKRDIVVGYLGFDPYGYLITTTDFSKAEVFTIPTLSTGSNLEIQSVSNKNYLCVWKSGNPGLEGWAGTLATEPSDGGVPLDHNPQTSIFGFYGYGTDVQARFQYDSTTTLDLMWWDVDGFVLPTPRGASAPETGATQLHIQWAEAP